MSRARNWPIAFSFAACAPMLSACSTLDFDDADRLYCAAPSIVDAPVASSNFDSLSNDELEAQVRSKDHKGLAAARAMGERYQKGQGVAQDIKKAAAWYRAAALILPDAHYIYVPGFGNVPGSVMAVGGSGPVTPGDPIAMQRLGEMYLSGIGVAVNSERAQNLLTCAARYGVIPDTLQTVPKNRLTI